MRATLSWGHKTGHCVSFGVYPDTVWVCGFDTAYDAYWWCVNTTCVDPLEGLPEKVSEWTKIKPKRTPMEELINEW